MYPIYYGGYSSHGPTHDSTFANITSEESRMVGPYFDFRGLENGDLIRTVSGTDYSSTFVDHLLDLFQGKDPKDMVIANVKEQIEPNKEKKEKVNKMVEDEVDFNLLKTLENDGIDMSFMSTLQAAYELRQEQEMQDLTLEEQLELTAHLIETLASAQNARLSAPPPTALSNVPGPSAREAKLATKVVTNLSNLTSKTKPESVMNLVQVRKTMGIAAAIPEAGAAATNGEQVCLDDEEQQLTNGVEEQDQPMQVV